MKAAPMTQKPSFPLMKQGDVQNIYHLQMPRWLFTDTKYMELALETKVAYTFLLNRFQLSRLNGWVNEDGAVFIIYTRRSLAEEMQVSYRKIIEAMKELTAAGLIWEKRCGRGDANQIYLALIEHPEPKSGSAPFVPPEHEAAGGEPEAGPEEAGGDGGLRSAESAPLDLSISQAGAHAPALEVPIQHHQKCGTGISKSAGTALPEVPERHPNYKEKRNTEQSHTEISLSVGEGGGLAETGPGRPGARILAIWAWWGWLTKGAMTRPMENFPQERRLCFQGKPLYRRSSLPRRKRRLGLRPPAPGPGGRRRATAPCCL